MADQALGPPKKNSQSRPVSGGTGTCRPPREPNSSRWIPSATAQCPPPASRPALTAQRITGFGRPKGSGRVGC